MENLDTKNNEKQPEIREITYYLPSGNRDKRF